MSSQKVVYRRLGRSGLRVSLPIIGAMSVGSPEWGPWILPKEKALPILKAAWDRGINTIDTANVYVNGESEKVIAAFIKELLIFTKCWGLVGASPGIFTYNRPELLDERDNVNQAGLSRAAIFNAVDASLRRLETSYIDLLQIHRYDPATPAEETMEALHYLVQAGKVRYLGASSMRAWQFAHLNHIAVTHGWTQFVSMQSEHSLLYREEEREMNPYCAFSCVGLIPWAPLAAGKLARPPASEVSTGTLRVDWLKARDRDQLNAAEAEIVRRVEEVAGARGWSMAQVALAWSVARVTSPIVGISSVERLEDAILGDRMLSEKEMEYLKEPYVPRPVRGHL